MSAVLGREFTYELIRRASTLEEEALRDGLMRLVESGLLRRRGELGDACTCSSTRWCKRPPTDRDAITEREYHRRRAEVLARDFPQVTDAQPELLAHHHAEAGEDNKAIVYLEKAGQLAARRSALGDAETHYRRARQLLLAKPRRRRAIVTSCACNWG